MSGPSVSVALCTYNGARFLDAQLESISAQSRQVDEVVVADDGSTDATLELIETRRATLPGLRILTPTSHLGVARNFERAISETTGDVVLLSDQDDVWHPDRIASALDTFDRDRSVLLVHGDARLIDDAGEVLDGSLLDWLRVDDATRARLRAGDSFAPLLRRNLITGATIAIRRELLASALPIPEGWLHDEWLAIIAASQGATRLLSDEVIDYRLHGANEVGAERVTLATRISRLRAPRRERNSRLLGRARSLAERLPPGPGAEAATAKLAHEIARSALPPSRIRRPIPIAVEASTGRYRRFGRGVDDIVRDLVQPD